MKRASFAIFALLLLLLAGSAVAADAPTGGVWTATAGTDSMQFNFWTKDHGQNGLPIPITAFTGLTEAQIAAVAITPVNFQLNREAGVISLEGTFKQREGSGHFTFQPNHKFAETLRSLGVGDDDAGEEWDNSSEGPYSDRRLFTMAIIDLSTRYVRDMQALGYRVGSHQMFKLRLFGVDRQVVGELRQLGYKDLTAEQLIKMRIHGVRPDYIREMQGAGFRNLSVEELVKSRIHGATPKFMAEMRALGYQSSSLDDFVRFRIHGVTAEYIRGLRERGYTNLSSEDLVRMRIHGVSLDYIDGLKKAGYNNVPADKLVEMRIHGIDASWVESMNGRKK
jgi:opacity protein-like surface antigen